MNVAYVFENISDLMLGFQLCGLVTEWPLKARLLWFPRPHKLVWLKRFEESH